MLAQLNNLLLAELSGIERWRGRNYPTHSTNLSWFQYVLVGIGIALVIALAALIRRRLQAQALRRKFSQQAKQLGLSSDESDVLAMLAAMAGIKQSHTIFTMEDAFEMGVSSLLTNDYISSFTPEARGSLSDTLVSLRQKLGFGSPSGLESETLHSTRQVSEGSAIAILGGAGGPVNATIAETNMLDMVIQAPAALDLKDQQMLSLRYCDGRSIWEFDMPVIRTQGDRVTLAHVEQVRFINRRRFPRIPVDKPSRMALYPFIKPHNSPELPQFESSKLLEIAGPSIKLQTSLRLEKGNTVLTILQLHEDTTVQAIGRVVRTSGQQEGSCTAVVALIATDAAGIDEMVHQTSLAEKENGGLSDGDGAELAMAEA